ncbi:MAG: PUR family DNA/RNA-binding protein [Flavobacteriales bacterium]|nr:PUR family DNA/RNA-binding protein [Flavobacteriales bacterium]MBP9080518.1 PUR family DNA/RNA-binding protein [Flavobacteriales bacterium]
MIEDEREDVYSKVVRAGKRTYYFDVRSTRGNDLYLTITERKKQSHPDGRVSYEKHKLFLYKEDFGKFVDGLRETLATLEHIRATGERPVAKPDDQPGSHTTPPGSSPYDDLRFEDLDEPGSTS